MTWSGTAPLVLAFGAWRRGHSYGSIVVGLERRTVIDILPDRQRDTIMAWLKENRQIQIICRDRGPGYGAAATEAAPQARQVADCRHLLKNAAAAFLSAVGPNGLGCAARFRPKSLSIQKL